MPDALTVLAEDHREVLEMLNQLSGGAGEPEGGSRERKAIAEQVAIAESKHEAVEELVFWPVVRSRLEHGEELARRALEQEETEKELLHDLDRITGEDAEFSSLVHRLRDAVQDHISFEESQVWPKLRLALTEAELDEMGRRMEAARRIAPTRPHPKTPSDPRLLAAVGPAVGALDRVRDLLTGRGKGQQGAGRRRIVLIGAAIGLPALALAVRALLRSRGEADRTGPRHLGGEALGTAAKAATGLKAARTIAEHGGEALGTAAKAATGLKAARTIAEHGGEALGTAAKAATGLKAARTIAEHGGEALGTAATGLKAARAVATSPVARLAGAVATERAGDLLEELDPSVLAKIGASVLHRAGRELRPDEGRGPHRHREDAERGALGELLHAAVLARGTAAVATRLAAMLRDD